MKCIPFNYVHEYYLIKYIITLIQLYDLITRNFGKSVNENFVIKIKYEYI